MIVDYNRLLRLCISCVAFVAVCLGCALAQTDTATLSGRVVDPSGLTVAGVQVELVDVDRNIGNTTKTNSAGLYNFPTVRPGHYRIVVSVPGFATVNLTGLTLNVQDSREQNFKLAVGSVLESVTVEAKGNLVDVSAAVSTNVDRQFVKELPLNGRSFQTLFQLTPGVTIASATFSEQGQFNVNGQRANANYFMVDGVSANVGATSGFGPGQSVGGSLPALSAGGGTNGLVSVDALQEFSIQTSGYAPEYGRTPGGQISILTRSGTNEFHGTGFDYLRNDLLDANDWFANHLGLKKAVLRQNDFGGVIGGPVFKDRTFFFFSYEGLRLRQPRIGISDVPSLASRQSALPSTRPFLDAFPLPTGPDEGDGLAPANYAFSNPSHLDTESIRIDQVFSGHLSAFARYNRSTSDGATRGGGCCSLNAISHIGTKLHTLTAGLTWLARPAITNDLRINWSWSGVPAFFVNDTLGGAVPISLQSVLPPDESPASSQFNIQLFGGNNAMLNYGQLSDHLQRQLNLVDIVSWQLGSHLIKAGVDYRKLTPEENSAHYSQFDSFNTVADLAAGNPSGGAFINSYFGPVEATYANYSLFAQDTWKAIPRLTVTYGLRWDYNPEPSAHGANGLPLLTVVGINNLANLSPAPVGTPLYHATRNNIAPRLGLAYQVRDSKAYANVLRAGFGLFYDLGNGPTGNVFTGFPFANAKIFSPQVFPLSPVDAAGLPPTLAPPFGFMNAFPSTLRQPYTYHWDLAWEQSVGTRQELTMSYVGAAGHRLIRQELIEGPQLSPNFTGIFYVNNAGYSKYNSLQVKVRRHQTKRLEILASYTWAHSLDNVSADSGLGLPAIQIDPALNYASSDFDIRHTGSLALDYQPPSSFQNSWARMLLNGWAVNTFLVARTAPPVDVGLFRDLGFGLQDYRPDVVPGVAQYIRDPAAPGGSKLNAAAFSVPPVPRQGTLGRNALRAFPLFQQDFSIRRSFRIHENLALQARFEAFNIFNHPNFAPPQSLFGFVSGGVFFPQSNFGISQSMFATGAAQIGSGAGFNPLYQVGGPRSLQVAVKLEF
jgi:hypothetical protein